MRSAPVILGRNTQRVPAERGLGVDHTTIYRWVQRYAPELERRVKRQLKPTNDSWRLDEPYVTVKGRWCYLYRAGDSDGNTLEFMLSEQRDARAAKRFFCVRSDSSKPPSGSRPNRQATTGICVFILDVDHPCNTAGKSPPQYRYERYDEETWDE